MFLRSSYFTLFPYTTLFRSLDAAAPGRWEVEAADQNPHQPTACRRSALPRPACDCRASAGGRDRKSTRLNSSHANISYAVFCLKKNKKNSILHNYTKRKIYK